MIALGLINLFWLVFALWMTHDWSARCQRISNEWADRCKALNDSWAARNMETIAKWEQSIRALSGRGVS